MKELNPRYSRAVEALERRHRRARADVGATRKAHKAAVALAQAADQASTILQRIAQHAQAAACGRLAGVVSMALESVFDDPYAFHLEFVEGRGRTEAVMRFVRAGLDVDPMHASGGGVVDVAAFALRVAAIALTRPPVRRLVVMDEPFKFVSPEFRPRIGEMLEVLSQELDFQFIMVTHVPELEMGTVIRRRDAENTIRPRPFRVKVTERKS